MTNNIVSKTRSRDASLGKPVALASQIRLKGKEYESQVWREMGREVDTDRGRAGVQAHVSDIFRVTEKQRSHSPVQMFSVYITATLPCQLEGKCAGRLDLVSSGGKAVGTRQGRARLERQPAQWPPSVLLLIGPFPIQMRSQLCFKCEQASWRHRWHSIGQGYVSSACQDL